MADPDDDEGLVRACEVALELAGDPATIDRCRAVAEPYDWERALAPQLERLYEGGAFETTEC